MSWSTAQPVRPLLSIFFCCLIRKKTDQARNL
jgi:hypothetical protein